MVVRLKGRNPRAAVIDQLSGVANINIYRDFTITFDLDQAGSRAESPAIFAI
ncbi:MAG: hypothetical protein ACOY6K_04470 [Pseudomonadota bacterium]